MKAWADIPIDRGANLGGIGPLRREVTAIRAPESNNPSALLVRTLLTGGAPEVRFERVAAG